MGPQFKRRRIPSEKIHDRIFNIFRFPAEIILQIFSFLTISECLKVKKIASDQTILADLLDTSIYDRTIVYTNRLSHSFLKNRHYKKPYEEVDQERLHKLISNKKIRHERIKPQKFVLSFTANTRIGDFEENLFLDVFDKLFQLYSNYFKLTTKFEIYMDLGNKSHEIDKEKQEIRFLDSLLMSGAVCHNLTTLNIVKCQNYVTPERNEITNLLNTTLETFKNLEAIFLSTNNLQNINNFKYPEGLRSLDLICNTISELPSEKNWLPSNLRYLNLSCNEITSLEGVRFPEMIEYLDIQLNAITCMQNIDFPQRLKTLIACGNEIDIKDNDIIDLPSSLEILNLLQNPFRKDLSHFKVPDSLRRIYLDAELKDINANFNENNIVIYY